LDLFNPAVDQYQRFERIRPTRSREVVPKCGIEVPNLRRAFRIWLRLATNPGYIASTEGGGAGNMVKRMVIGFGAGTAEMNTVVEGYVTTPQGLQKLGSGTLTFSGNKTPALVVPDRSGYRRSESGRSHRSWRN
jgi:hypothetical protein